MFDKLTTISDPENDDLLLALEYVENTGCHIFLTGRAGTGKTTFLKNLKANTDKRMIVAAPTGVAAMNAGGVTLHSFFQLPFGPFIPGSDAISKNKARFFRFSKEKRQIIKGLDLLVIDEISMVRADVLDAVDTVLRYHRRNNLPFGGVQLLLIGDLYQLPPVVKPNEWELLKQYYDSVYFFSSQTLSRIDLINIELKKVYRQEDEHFIHLLNKVRDNHLDETAAQTLNKQVNVNFVPRQDDGYITLTTHNRKADAINRKKLDAIPEESHILSADISGEFPEYQYPTFPELSLKKGAQVMFLRNDTSPEKRYYNGKIGKVESILPTTIHVICPEDKESIAVEPVEWQNIKYLVNQETLDIEQEVIGKFKQFALKPAWAITIHKSQGLTFEKAVVDSEEAFAQGQVYVALSRCRSLEGLVLSSPVPVRGIRSDAAISGFMSESMDTANLKQRILDEKISFQQQLLMTCFDFQVLNNKLGYAFNLVIRNRDLVHISGVTDFEQIQALTHKEIVRVGESFKRQLTDSFPQQMLPCDDSYIQERVKKASDWFSNKMDTVLGKLVDNLSLETDGKVLRKKLKNAFDNLKLEIAVKQAGIRSCSDGFSSSRYLRAMSTAQIESISPKPAKKKAVSYIESDISHPKLFEKLRGWRLELAEEKKIPAFQIFHQRVLIQIVVCLPQTMNELEQISGVGPKTILNYGEDILKIVTAYCDEHGMQEAALSNKKQES